MKTPMLGSAYASRSLKLNAQRMVNLYAEVVETHDGKEIGGLFGCPGLRVAGVAGDGPTRGAIANARQTLLYVVSGDKFYEFDRFWNATLRGTLTSIDGPVSMAINATQIMMVDGASGYIYTIATTTLAEITDPDFPTANTVGFIDQYFVFNIPDTGTWGLTALGDGSSIDALDVVTAEGSPDNLVSVLVDHREIWAFGQESIEVWAPGSDPDFPYSRSQFIETGSAAAHAPAKMDNSVFWVDQHGIVRRADGYLPRRVSTHWVERMLAELGARNTLIGFAYEQEGHAFYQLTSPEGLTLVYDVAASASIGVPMWHERAYRDPATAVLGRHRANWHCFFNSQNVVGDYENGNIYVLDLDTFDDAGAPRKWLRSWRALPQGTNTKRATFIDALRVDCDVGVGAGDGSDPTIVLRVSRDGGNTYGRELERSIGKTGEYGKAVIFGPLSAGADTVFELSGAAPVKTALIGAHIEGEQE